MGLASALEKIASAVVDLATEKGGVCMLAA
jgi:NAD/NADP transhydrogenase alpha subunit